MRLLLIEMRFRNPIRILALLTYVLLSVVPSPAEEPSDESITKLVSQIPASLQSDKPLFLSAANSGEYQDLLIAPLANFIEEGSFNVRLVRSASKRWSYSSLWNQASQENEQHFALGSKGAIVLSSDPMKEVTSYTGFPFGLPDAVLKEEDAAKRAKKILLSVGTLPGIEPEAVYGIELLWFGRKSIFRRASGLFYREHLKGGIIANPQGVPPEDPLFLPKYNRPINWRELLQLISPPVIFGYASLTYRYQGVGISDDAWTFSPVLGRSRRILESNRTDPILGGKLTLDDLFVSSVRADRVKVSLAGEKIILAPFPQIEAIPLEKSNVEANSVVENSVRSQLLTARGQYKNRAGDSVGVLWNSEVGTFPGSASWVPTSIQLIPRKLWILELQPLDPFSSHGTEVLFVDQETFLPFYKVIYDRRGVFSRFVMTSWNLIVSEDEKIKFPAVSFVLAVDRSGEKAQAMETQYVRRLSGDSPLKKKLGLLFDIREHDKRVPSKKEEVKGGLPPQVAEPLENPDD